MRFAPSLRSTSSRAVAPGPVRRARSKEPTRARAGTATRAMASEERTSALRIRCAHCDAVFDERALPYDADVDSLASSALREKFVRLSLDSESVEFLNRARARGRDECERLARKCTELRRTMSLTEANAILGRGKMFVFSDAHVETLMRACGEGAGGGWFLDVGAGEGEVTRTLARRFAGTCATESSPGMASRLREKGFDVVLESDTVENVVRETRARGGDVSEDGFDVVAALNLCDRVRSPRALLRDLKRALKAKTGILILAIVVPFRPFVENADGTRSQPDERLDVPSAGSWESGVDALWTELIAPLGFDLVALSRVPYISEGDHLYDAYVLDDAVFVLRAPL